MKAYFYFFTLATILLFNSLETKIKIYALYTPSHEILKDNWFLPSIKDDFEVVLHYVDQTCPTGKFMRDGWTKTTIQKIDLIIRAIKENWGEIFIFSDVDIQFFQPIEDTILRLMKGRDLVAQKNHPGKTLCSGFFACRANEKTLKFWKAIKYYMAKNPNISDQKSLNYFIHKRNKQYGIRWGFLPPTFFCGGTFTAKIWNPGDILKLPENIMIHHANWTIGIENKIAQLQHVKNTVLGNLI